ncbi:16S rRNA (uracil(1498)-N(3))-methyltransferase [Marinimicrobium sp. C6131]|uniref:16S rRNA (uracil(1498)-N(3))-methyltransferase n=1 Tax=Marinimicrobium sp. C6131 TaxID=3022676 RepID=UPI00223E77B1|nr:16S rRNA (uracil(1498)-N(3))-methyltransferase [Marinimicrobium sp. C6131]UZJ43330.1 16S rRNA (uracil(1498)-N(3))-methyltransferase [Marinimicrobium sp. C6131]
MRVPRVFTDQPLQTGATVTLEEAPSRHLAKVLRMTPGRELILFNGEGGEFAATLAEVGKKSVQATLGAFTAEDRESPLNLELAIGLSRGDRMDWVIQKATELGATRITPLFTERTEVKLKGDRLDKKWDHWRQVIISACEQCQRNRLPALAQPLTLTEWLATEQPPGSRRLVLHHRDSKGLPAQEAITQVSLLVGPEGGLSEEEIERARNAGCDPLTLGPRVMRTETAPVAAISLAQYLWGDWR